jgi:hypothetical protein
MDKEEYFEKIYWRISKRIFPDCITTQEKIGMRDCPKTFTI